MNKPTKDQLTEKFDRYALLPLPADDADDPFRSWVNSLSTDDKVFVHLRARTLEIRLRRMAAMSALRPADIVPQGLR